MPIFVDWLDAEKSIVYTKLEGNSAPEELFVADKKFRAMLAEADRLVDLIADYSTVVYFAPYYTQTSQQLTAMEHKNLRLVVFMGNQMAWDLFQAYSREYGGISFQGAYAATIEAAREIIRAVRVGEKIVVNPPLFAHWN